MPPQTHTNIKVFSVIVGFLSVVFFILLIPIPTHAQIRSDIDQRLQQGPIIVDHTNTQLYHDIPDSYLQRAEAIRVFFANRSVGGNINDGLSCLQTQSSSQSTPAHCTRWDHLDDYPEFDSPPETVTWTKTANRANWTFLYWSELGCSINPSGWDANGFCTDEYIRSHHNQYDVVTHEQSYLQVNEGSNIASPTQGYVVDGPNYDVYDMMQLQTYLRNQSPGSNKLVIYMSSSLARGIGTGVSTDFNNQLRNFAQTNHKILLDVAAILSHDPYGNPCYDNRDGIPYRTENYANDGHNYPAICQHYTTEVNGGHLGSTSSGKIGVAQGFWVLTAQIAGWDPGTNTTPPPTASPTPSPTSEPPPPPGDYTNDGQVNLDDYWEVTTNFTSPTPAYSILDFNLVITNFGN